MYIITEYDGVRYFMFERDTGSPDSLRGAVPAWLNFFKKYTDHGVIRFTVTSFLLADGTYVPAVRSRDHLSLLQEVLDALEDLDD